MLLRHVASFFCQVTPVERVKCILQAAPAGEFEGPVDCVAQIVRTDGIQGLLTRGLGVTLLREVPSYGFYFGAYEFTKTSLLALVSGLPPSAQWCSALVPLVGGAAAGAAARLPDF
mmetsp:Transcript_46361/g.104714  ORF Transcript_46361/g.104714 Transcript_46361/m.104714 type:complete len:116 (-) Transcript_46361:298-645(-)